MQPEDPVESWGSLWAEWFFLFLSEPTSPKCESPTAASTLLRRNTKQPGRLWSRRPCLHCLLRSRQSQCTAVTLEGNLWRLVYNMIIHRKGGSVYFGFQIFGTHCSQEYLTNWYFIIVNVMLYLEEWVIRMSEWRRSPVYSRVSQKNQKSEFCFATKPSGFHRLDEPPE